jgi:hypothetical protein
MFPGIIRPPIYKTPDLTRQIKLDDNCLLFTEFSLQQTVNLGKLPLWQKNDCAE